MTGCNQRVWSAVCTGDQPESGPADMRESEQQVIDQPTGGTGLAGLPPEPETVQRLRPSENDAAVVAEVASGAAPGSGDLTDELP